MHYSFSFFLVTHFLKLLLCGISVLGGLRPLRCPVFGRRQTNTGADRSDQANG